MALDVHEVSLLADYFVICSARNNRQIQAIVNDLVEQAQKKQINVKNVEGKDGASWILIDLGDVIIHVFNQEEREFYNLEKLWAGAPLVDLSEWVQADGF